MTMNRLGGIAEFAAAGTYLLGFAALFAVLLPAGYSFDPATAHDAVAFLERNAGMMIAWNSVIYILNAICVAVLVVSLHASLASQAAPAMKVASVFGLIWVGLLVAAGMVANSAISTVTRPAAADPRAAADLWQTLRAVENGLGGGNEIAGSLWLGVSMMAAHTLPIPVRALGTIAAAAGILTLVPVLSEPMGAAFGLATLAWFIAIGVGLLCQKRREACPAPR